MVTISDIVWDGIPKGDWEKVLYELPIGSNIRELPYNLDKKITRFRVPINLGKPLSFAPIDAKYADAPQIHLMEFMRHFNHRYWNKYYWERIK